MRRKIHFIEASSQKVVLSYHDKGAISNVGSTRVE